MAQVELFGINEDDLNWFRNGDPMSQGIWIVSSVWIPITFVAVYMAVCLIPPYYIPNIREALVLWQPTFDHVMNCFNMYRAYALGVEGTMLIYYAASSGFSPFCQPVGVKSEIDGKYAIKIVYALTLYCILKFVDLFDALVLVHSRFYVNRLQMYHHISLAVVSWFGVKYVPGGSTVFYVVANCFAGFLFYVFHSFNINRPKKQQVNFKQALYTTQAIQFTIVTLHIIIDLCQSNCGYPKFADLILLTYVASLAFMVYYIANVNVFQIIFYSCSNDVPPPPSKPPTPSDTSM